MVEQVGTNYNIGFKQTAGSWGTGIALGTGDKYEFISEGQNPDIQLIRSAALNGSPFRGPGLKGNEFHSGPIRFPLDYETAHKIIGLAFGSSAAPVQQGTALSWLHEAVVAASDKGIMTDICFWQNDAAVVREYPSVKWGDLTLSIKAGEEPYIEVQCTPIRLITDQSGLNDISSLANVTQRATPQYVEFKDLSMFLANRSTGTPLDEPHDEFFISGFELRLTKNLRTQSVTTRNAPYVDEPIRNNFFDVGFTVTVAEIEDFNRLAEVISKGNKMARVRAVGAIIEETFAYTLDIELPSFQWASVGDFNIDGPEIVAPSYVADAAKSPTSVAGFSHTDAVRIKVTNTDPNDAVT